MDDREKLRQHFQDQPAEKHPGRWEAMWQQNVTPWDRSAPHPILAGVLDDNRDIIGRPYEGFPDIIHRKKALVPGCGRGYDVSLLASYGYDAYGVDVSQTAIDACIELDKTQSEDTTKYPIKDTKIGRGSRNFVRADIFKDNTLARCHTGGMKFDVIYDHTFLCALPPQLRPKWSEQMSKLLAPGGSLLCLAFPLEKSPKAGGPPHGLSSELYEQLLSQPGQEVEYGDDGHVKPVVPGEQEIDDETGFVRVANIDASNPHEAGHGSDMFYIYQHVGSGWSQV